MANSIGVKLQIDEAIRPRDFSLGTKLIVMLPETAKTVQDVKNYIADSVLKTPIRFNLYIGEFRIRDEEDVVVFTCFPEVYRVSPACVEVPLSPSTSDKGITALMNSGSPLKQKFTRSATPEVSKEPKAKRVKFNDTASVMTTSSPLPNITTGAFEGFDQIDESNIRYPADDSVSGIQQTPNSFVRTRITTTPSINILNTGMIMDDTLGCDETRGSEKKKRRKRRHKKKKSTVSDEDSQNGDSEASTIIISGDGDCIQPIAQDISSGNSSCTQSQAAVNGNKMEVSGSNESFFADNESDISEETSFKVPQQLRPILKKQKRDVISALHRTQSPVPSPSTSSLPTTPVTKKVKTRADTPILPKVLKNPGVYEKTQLILKGFNFNSSIAEVSENGEHIEVPSKKPSVRIQRADVFTKAPMLNNETANVSHEGDEDRYERLKPINDVSEIGEGDVIAFKTLEMGENYCPELSSYKEAVITAKDGNSLTLDYIRGVPVIKRDGIFELDDADYVVEPLGGADAFNKNFTDMSSVKLVSNRQSSQTK